MAKKVATIPTVSQLVLNTGGSKRAVGSDDGRCLFGKKPPPLLLDPLMHISALCTKATDQSARTMRVGVGVREGFVARQSFLRKLHDDGQIASLHVGILVRYDVGVSQLAQDGDLLERILLLLVRYVANADL